MNALRFDGFRNIDPAANGGQRLRLLDVFPSKTALQLSGDAFCEDRRTQFRYVMEFLCRNALIPLFPKDLKGVCEHMIDVLNRDHLIALLRLFVQSFTLVGSSNQYSFSSGINSNSTMLESVCSSASFRLQK